MGMGFRNSIPYLHQIENSSTHKKDNETSATTSGGPRAQ